MQQQKKGKEKMLDFANKIIIQHVLANVQTAICFPLY